MPGIGGTLDIARWSLYASQLAIEVTAHNLANANTEGYSRQSLRIQPNNPITMGPGQLGTGVKAQEITRAYDRFLADQVNQKRSDYNFWSTQKNSMEEIEMIFNESDEYGLNHLLGEFWNAWGDLANNPDGMPERQALVAKTQNFTSAIKDIDYNLRQYQNQLDSNIQSSVDQVNSLIDQVADLNLRISSSEIEGVMNANDLRDSRDRLLEELSTYMDINYYEEETSGQVQVFILGGTPLVLGVESYRMSTERNTTTGHTDVVWNDDSGRQINVTQKLDSGKIGGWIDVRDSKVDGYVADLNTLTEELIWQVNSLHSEGAGLKPVTSMVGTTEIGAATDNLGTDFHFGSRYDATGSFDIVTYDAAGNATTYNIDPAGDTVQDLIDEINLEIGGGEVVASLNADGFFQLQATGNNSFAIKPAAGGTSDGSLAILGVNSFFSWNDDVTNATALTQTIDVSAEIAADPERIAGGYLDNTNRVAPGDNSVSLAISALQDKVVTMGGNQTTIDSYYSSFVAGVGVDVQNAQMNESYNNTLLSQFTQRKESVTGVNMDEEMTTLLKFQQAYQAAAKLIATADEMFQTLLSVK